MQRLLTLVVLICVYVCTIPAALMGQDETANSPNSLEFYHAKTKAYRDSLGEFMFMSSDFDSLFPTLERAVEFAERATKTIQDSVVWSGYLYFRRQKGMSFVRHGNRAKAIEYLQESIRIGQNHFSKGEHYIGKIITSLGGIDMELGNPHDALDRFREAELVFLKVYGEGNVYTAFSRMNIGVGYRLLQEYEQALLYYEKARRSLSEIDSLQLFAYYQVGQIHAALGQYSRAIENLELQEKLWGEDHPQIVRIPLAKGNIYREQKNYVLAETQYKQALDIAFSMGEAGKIFEGDITATLGNLYMDQSLYDNALSMFERNLTLVEDRFGPDDIRVAAAHTNLGNLYDARQMFLEAVLHYHSTLKITSEDNLSGDLGTNPAVVEANAAHKVIDPLCAKAKSYYSHYKSNSEIEALTGTYSAVNTVAGLVDKIRYSKRTEESKFRLGSQLRPTYEIAVAVASELHNRSDEIQHLESMLHFMEQGKYAVLSEHTRAIDAAYRDKLPASVSGTATRLNRDLNEVERALLLLEPDSSIGNITHRDSLLERQFELERNYSMFLDSLKYLYPSYVMLTSSQKKITIEELQNTLDQNTALISYFASQSEIYALMITNDRVVPFCTIRSVDFDSALARFPEVVLNIVHKDQFHQLATTLYSTLVKPIQNHIGDRSNLIIIPDGSLGRIPFGALVATDKESIEIPDYAEMPFLIHDYSISYHYSLSLLMRNRFTTISPDYELIAFAPTFEEEERQEIVSDYIVSAISELQNAFSNIFRDDGFAPLPGAQVEVATITNLFQPSSQAFTAELATEAAFRKMSPKARMLHIATHGVLNSAQPSLSGLAFETSSGEREKNDGFLYSHEMLELTLNADLVVLSSCETGTGPFQNGEGIIALSRSLLLAGAQNLVTSLWKVEDNASQNLMIHFYESIKDGMDYSSALREAKLKLIENNRGTAAPLYWAPHILIGK